MTRAKHARDLIKQLRSLYRDSLRRERTFYWEARLRPAKYPLLYATYIQDGATQTMYVCPRFIGLAPSGHYLQVKLVGNIVHGHVLVLHLVYPQVADDANLMCHCLDSTIEETKKVRVAKDQPDFLPANWRSQLDGVRCELQTTVRHPGTSPDPLDSWNVPGMPPHCNAM